MSAAKLVDEVPLTKAKVPKPNGHKPDPRRVAWGRESWKRRRGLTPEGRDRIGQSTLARKPWLHSTGPRTEAGRRQSVLTAKKRQTGKLSQRETTYYLGILRASVAIMDYIGPDGTILPDKLKPGRATDDLLKFSSVFQQSIPGVAGMDVPALGAGLADDSMNEEGKTTKRKRRRRPPKQPAFYAPRWVPSFYESLRNPPATSILSGIRPTLLDLRPSQPWRPTAWLWHLAGAFLEMKRKRWKKLGAPGLREVVEFRAKLQVCQSHSQLKRLATRHPALFKACEIALEPIDSPRRQSLEILVLADVPQAEIGAILGIDLAVIEAYEQVYFAVRGSLDSPSYIVGQVIQIHGADPATCRTRWLRHSAYFGGPFVARCLVGLYGGPGIRLPADEVLPAIDAEVVKLMVEAKVAMELLPLDDRRVQRLLTRYVARARNGVRNEPASSEENQEMREATRVAVAGIREVFRSNPASKN